MTITATRIIEWDAGHRLLRHESKCAHVHGHRYRAEVTVEAKELDVVGRVVDFGVIKELVGGWVDQNWDHAFVVGNEDVEMKRFLVENHQKHYTLFTEPTAENMALVLLDLATLLLPQELTVTRVRIWETPNCYVDATRGGVTS